METNHSIRPPEPGLAAMFWETVPFILFVAVAGPPVLFIAAPWVLLALMLAGPFALLVVIVTALVAATILIACIATILVRPLLVMRRRRAPVDRSIVAAPLRVQVAA